MTKQLREKRRDEYRSLCEAKKALEQLDKRVEIKGYKIIMENTKYNLPAIQDYLSSHQSTTKNEDPICDEECDDSSSTLTPTTRKRERPTGSKTSIGKNILKKSKKLHAEK